jgi:hypothetical protein
MLGALLCIQVGQGFPDGQYGAQLAFDGVFEREKIQSAIEIFQGCDLLFISDSASFEPLKRVAHRKRAACGCLPPRCADASPGKRSCETTPIPWRKAR